MPFLLPFLPFLAANGGVLTVVAVKKLKKLQSERHPKALPAVRSAIFKRLERWHRSGKEDVLPVVKALVVSKPRTETEEKTQKQLKQVTVGLGLGLAGIFFFPLQIAGLVFIVPLMVDTYKSGYRHLKHERRVSVEVLTGTLMSGALVGGFFVTLNMGAWFVVFVRWLALKTEAHSKQGIIDLFGQQGRFVWLLIDGAAIETPVERVRVGDLISVQAGQMIPLDGVIVEGYASLDQHVLTGEAQPVEKGPGDKVLAATVAISGRINIRVEKAGEATTAAEIGRILTDTSDFKASLVSRADAFNDKMALPFIAISAVSVPFVGLSSALAILQATPGYRMVLYGPLSMLSYIHLAAQAGILIKDGRSLESLQEVDTVVFDKTGTLTRDQPEVRSIHACPGFDRDTVLAYAAMAETKQSHPIARAILEAAAAQGIVANASDDIEYEIGYGIAVWLNGAKIRVGSMRFMRLNDIEIPSGVVALEDAAHEDGYSLVLVAVDQAIAGALVLQPSIREEARAIVTQLRTRGLRLYIMSGDHEAPTRRLAHSLGMDGYFAEVLPTGKASLVQKLQMQGRKVCFVGDGINDAIALKSANVSISLHGATTIAIDTAQIVLMEGDLVQLPRIFEIAKEFEDNMRFNFLAATVPCVVIVGGALFFSLSFFAAMILYQISVPFALYNTVRPLLAAKPAEKL